MLPSSSSQFTRYGQINHLKKFWLLQTQLEKQEQNTTAATLSLGTAVNANVKETKNLVTSSPLVTNADHHTNGSSISGHGSLSTCSGSSSRAGSFPHSCSSDQTGSLRYHNSNHVGLAYSSSQCSNIRGSPTLSLAVNCESVAHPVDFLKQTCSPSSLRPTSNLRLHHTSHLEPPLMQSLSPNQVRNYMQDHDEEDHEFSECSSGRDDKGVYLSMDNMITSSPRISASGITLSSKDQFAVTRPDCKSPTIISPSCNGAAFLSSTARGSHGVVPPLRTCTVCGTSKTPLWRGGPNGPKSLCNACGIRMKKTKRLQAAMEAAGGDAERIKTISAQHPAAAGACKRPLTAAKVAAVPGKVGTLKRKLAMEAAENQSDRTTMMVKKKKGMGLMIRASTGSDEESNRNLSNLLAQDVEEAAVLLMALSCGLVLS